MSVMAEHAADDDLAAVDYSKIPYIPRRWLWPGYIPVGNPVMLAAAGGTGKGMLACAVIARVVLGLPFPGEDQDIRREPGRAIYIAGTEDDQFEDLAPRLRAAISAAAAEFGLDYEVTTESGAIRLVHDLSEWRDGSPFEVPGDMTRLGTEVAKVNALGGPAVALVVLDPLADLLGASSNISSVKGARMVLKPVKRFARTADLAVIIIHHLTKDGKVSGSPAVLDALRLAFVVKLADDNPLVRVITNRKTNLPESNPQRYVITGDGADAHAMFVEATDARAERVSQAAERAERESAPELPGSAEPAAGSIRARMAAAACKHPGKRGTAAECSDCPLRGARPVAPPAVAVPPVRPIWTPVPAAGAGPFRIMRREHARGEDIGPAISMGDAWPSREAARDRAERDAGQALAWHTATVPGMETAAYRRGDFATVSYGILPAHADT